MMSAIRVKAKSRVNFAKIYTVGHNVEVYDFGDVHSDYMTTLKCQWTYVLKREKKRIKVDSDEDEDDE